MSNDTNDELHNALHHLELARQLELSPRPRYPRPARRADVLEAISQAQEAARQALRAAGDYDPDNDPDPFDEAYQAALPEDAPGAWIRRAIDRRRGDRQFAQTRWS